MSAIVPYGVQAICNAEQKGELKKKQLNSVTKKMGT